ncbi:MAG: polyhydroxyalkanoate synthesis repressor PhaR [Hyphomicrobium sp.]|nr:MAG: polyhydroxyalkanoate synthesis repressor PhaR [Hyphomicrobium sp.]
MLKHTDVPAEKKEAVVVKKYANRRLYNTETSTYVTLEDLAVMVRSDRDFVVYDAKTGDDLTHAVLTQIIVEQENRQGGQTMLPIPFLRQLIRFYDDQIGRVVPGYLQFSLENLVKEQEKFRTHFSQAIINPGSAFEFYQEQARKNMTMFEQAMAMWSPFSAVQASMKRAADSVNAANAAASSDAIGMAPDVQAVRIAAAKQVVQARASNEPVRDDLAELKSQLATMQQKIEKLARDRN